MKTISEEYILQLSRLHDQKASFGDAKGLKQSEKYIKRYNPESIIDYGCGKGGVTLALQEAYPNLNIEIKVIKTKGDLNLESSIEDLGGKSAFTSELDLDKIV